MRVEGRTVLAYFDDPGRARQAWQALRDAGFRDEDMQLDRISRYPGEGTEVYQNPQVGRVGSLARLTLGANVDSDDAGILMAADPGASGLADTRPAEMAWLVALVAPDDQSAEQARALLRQHGGLV